MSTGICHTPVSYTHLDVYKRQEEMIEAADVIIGNVKPDRLHAPEGLQWLQLNSAGADAYVKPEILTVPQVFTARLWQSIALPCF